MKILLLNVHSALNLGDEAIMFETIRALRSAFPDATITIAANDPQSWRAYREACVVGSFASWVIDRRNNGWRWRKSAVIAYAIALALALVGYRLFGKRLTFGAPKQRQLLAAYYEADLVLSCGGGNFYAHHSPSIAFLWTVITVAFAFGLGKRVVFLPQSFGPVAGSLQRRVLRMLLHRATHVLVREEQSLAFVQSLHIAAPISLIPDLALGLPLHIEHFESTLIQSRPAPRIGITVMDRSAQTPTFVAQKQYETALAETIIHLVQRYDASIFIFAQCYGPTTDQDDRLAAQRLAKRVQQSVPEIHLLPPFADAAALKAAYAQMDCVIATRMHAAVFALSSNVPTALIAYQPKSIGLMSMFGQERYYYSIETVTGEELLTSVQSILAHRDALTDKIRSRFVAIQSQLANWVAYLDDHHSAHRKHNDDPTK